MNEKTTLSAAVDELFQSGPEALARAIEEEEARLPILGELRREVEDSGDPRRLRLNAARYLAFLETHPRDPEQTRTYLPPRLPADPRRPRALMIEEQVHLLYLSTWRPEWLPDVGRPFPWARSPLQRAWARVHSQDLACLSDMHYWLACGGRALGLPLGLLRLAVEEALTMALDAAPEDYSHLDLLEASFLEDPLLVADRDLGAVLRALRARVSYYRLLHQYEASGQDLLSLAREHAKRDLSGDPFLEALFRLRILRSEEGNERGEEARELRKRLDELLEAREDSKGLLEPVRLAPSRGHLERGLRQLDREVGALRGRAISSLEEALRREGPDSVLPVAREWLWSEWDMSRETSSRAQRLLAEMAGGSARWDLVCDAFHVYALTRLPVAPLECFHRLQIALRLCGHFTASKTGVVCDLLIVAWLYGLPVDYEEDVRIEMEQPGGMPEGRIISALCPVLGLYPVKLLSPETYGVHRLLRAMSEVPRSDPNPRSFPSRFHDHRLALKVTRHRQSGRQSGRDPGATPG